MIYVLFVILCLAVLLETFYDATLLLIPSVCAVLGSILYGFWLKRSGSSVRIVWATVLIFLVVGIGIVRTASIEVYSEDFLQSYNEEFVAIEGTVAESVQKRTYRTRFVIEDVVIDGIPYDDLRVLVWDEEGRYGMIGDTVFVQGSLIRPDVFETDAGRVFDYTSYLAKDNIYFEISRPLTLHVESGGSGFNLERSLATLKLWFLGRIESVLPEPHSSLAGGILLGEQQSLGERWQEIFRVVGLTHIIVLSGYNVSIVVNVVLYLLAFLPLLYSSVVAIIGITLFALLVGGGATVVRASLMAGLLVLAQFFHRPYDALRALMIAGAVMILINPRIVAHDISFQLSFLATLGIILTMPLAQRLFCWVPPHVGLREIIATTFSAQLFVFPWIMYSIGTFSVVSFLANVLVLPSVPLAMLASTIAGFLPTTLTGWPAYVLLAYELSVAEIVSYIPYASINIPALPLWAVLVVYAVLIALTGRSFARSVAEDKIV